jgi:hypothetical protein
MPRGRDRKFRQLPAKTIRLPDKIRMPDGHRDFSDVPSAVRPCLLAPPKWIRSSRRRRCAVNSSTWPEDSVGALGT